MLALSSDKFLATLSSDFTRCGDFTPKINLTDVIVEKKMVKKHA